MPRIMGVDIPNDRPTVVSLTYLYGVGPKIAAELLQWFGTAEGAIEAAKESDSRITKAKRQALIEFEAKLEVTRQLVTLVDSLPLPSSTRI